MAKIQYLISYDLANRDGKRDYGPWERGLTKMEATPYLKSQWLYECDEDKTAKQVSDDVLEFVKASSKLKKGEPAFEPLSDKLLVSPFFPRKLGRIYLVAQGKNQAL